MFLSFCRPLTRVLRSLATGKAGLRPVFFSLLASLVLGPGAAFSAIADSAMHATTEPLLRPAQTIAGNTFPVMLDITRAGKRLVSAGERGIILFSDDNGSTWQQAEVPVSVTLTAIRFASDTQGWAVGHSGVILHTTDGGRHWQLQLDGKRAAQLMLEQAQNSTAGDADQQLREAQLFIEDGADKPFLALEFKNEREGLVVGAYGLAFRTSDGGASWQPWSARMSNPNGLHWHAIYRDGNTWAVAGEQGLFARSTDDGHHFEAIETPYEGSFFTLSALQPGVLVLGGLRGHAFLYTENEGSFEQLPVPIPTTLVASQVLADGAQLFLNQSGQWLLLRDKRFEVIRAPEGAPANAVSLAPDGALWAATWRGLVRAQLP